MAKRRHTRVDKEDKSPAWEILERSDELCPDASECADDDRENLVSSHDDSPDTTIRHFSVSDFVGTILELLSSWLKDL